MSCDLTRVDAVAVAELAKSLASAGLIQDVIIHVLGLPRAEARHGTRVREEPPEVAEFRRVLTNTPGYLATHHTPVIAIWNAGMREEAVTDEVLPLIRRFFDPRGRLIIAGESRGGLNALGICRRLSQAMPFFNVRRLDPLAAFKEFGNPQKGDFSGENGGGTLTLRTRVDLLLSYDSTLDADANGRQGLVAPVVRRCLNHYQTKSMNGGWHGKLNAASGGTQIEHHDWTALLEKSADGLQAHLFAIAKGKAESHPKILQELFLPVLELEVGGHFRSGVMD